MNGDASVCPYSCLTEDVFVRHAASQRLLKEEDTLFVHEEGDVRLFAVADGHHGRNCAAFVKENFWPCLKHRLPTIAPTGNDDDTFQILAEIRKAMLAAFMSVDKAWYKENKHSGTTLTVGLIVGRLLTIANVGDSSAFLHDGKNFYQLSKDHRLEDSPSETSRLWKSGLQLAPLNASLSGPAEEGETGYGPLRVWPGGLAVSRSIGDADVTSHVLCIPHIRQLLVPQTGARLILASDGIWDALGLSKVEKNLKHKSREKCSEKLMNLVSIVQGGELEDDASVIITDILINTVEVDFKYVVKDQKKGQKQNKLKKLTKHLSGRKKTKKKDYENFLADVDGLSMVPEHVRQRSVPSTKPYTVTEDFTVFGKDVMKGVLFKSPKSGSFPQS